MILWVGPSGRTDEELGASLLEVVVAVPESPWLGDIVAGGFVAEKTAGVVHVALSGGLLLVAMHGHANTIVVFLV